MVTEGFLRMRPTSRKLLGAAGLLAFLLAYLIVAASIGSALAAAPLWVQLPYFAIVGTFWILPLRPLFRWMNKA